MSHLPSIIRWKRGSGRRLATIRLNHIRGATSGRDSVLVAGSTGVVICDQLRRIPGVKQRADGEDTSDGARGGIAGDIQCSGEECSIRQEPSITRKPIQVIG